MVWAYVDGGAEELVTLRANEEAFGRWALRQRVLAGLPSVDLSATVAGVGLTLPVLLAPTGGTGLIHWHGELGAAKAAEAAGTRAVISTSASYSPEEIGNATREDHFFQLYSWSDPMNGDPSLTRSVIERAQSAGFRALFVTVDVPVVGNREQERKLGMGLPPTLTPGGLLNVASRPRWCYGLVRHRRAAVKLLSEGAGARAAVRAAARLTSLFRPDLDWDDFSWIRDEWSGPLFVKGVLDADDAARAVELGADGVVVSNHGGRQLDGVVAALDALPAIAERIGGRAQVLLDGGIRRGTDVVKALCLGADAVCIGRPYVYGLAARGTRGVAHVIEILRQEVHRTMMLMGVPTVAELDRSHVAPARIPVGALASVR
jgi:L-lactate dehydrogenase (cytochrome)/(S)-mandelate dehydrogenase